MAVDVSIVVPYIRPEGFRRLVNSIQGMVTGGLTYEIVAEEDTERIGCPQMLKRLVGRAEGELIMFLADDTEVDPFCLMNAARAMERLPDGWGVVGLNDGRGDGLCTHWLASKKMLPYLDGEFFSTEYIHTKCDWELLERTKELGRYTFAEDARVIHHHPSRDDSPADEDYDRVYADDALRHDWLTYCRRKQERAGFRLAIGLPLVSTTVPAQFMLSFIQLEKPDYLLLVPTTPPGEFSQSIAAVRNGLVWQALEAGATHLLFMDTDQVYHTRDTVQRLLSHNKDAVGAVVHRRYPPFDALCYRGNLGRYHHVPDREIYSGELIPVDATGCGCILFRTKLFIEEPYPWFDFDINDQGKPVGEDILWCHKLRESGVEIYVDTSIQIGHLSLTEVDRGLYELYKKVKGYEWAEGTEPVPESIEDKKEV